MDQENSIGQIPPPSASAQNPGEHELFSAVELGCYYTWVHIILLSQHRSWLTGHSTFSGVALRPLVTPFTIPVLEDLRHRQVGTPSEVFDMSQVDLTSVPAHSCLLALPCSSPLAF